MRAYVGFHVAGPCESNAALMTRRLGWEFFALVAVEVGWGREHVPVASMLPALVLRFPVSDAHFARVDPTIEPRLALHREHLARVCCDVS